MHFLSTTIVASLLAAVSFAAPAPAPQTDVSDARKSWPTFAQHTIFTPAADYRDPKTLYARTVELDNGDLLATWENYSPGESCPRLMYLLWNSDQLT
jgi:hypothetical protein